jgi:hypothetical protein
VATRLASGFDGTIGTESHVSKTSKAAILDLLCTIIPLHPNRIKRLASRFPFHIGALRVLRYREKSLVLQGLRLVRALLGLKDSFFQHELTTNHAFSAVMSAFLLNYPRDNLISAQVPEIFECTAGSGTETSYVGQRLRSQFAPLLRRFKHFQQFLQRTEPKAQTSDSLSSALPGRAAFSDADDAYFSSMEDADDEDTESEATSKSQQQAKAEAADAAKPRTIWASATGADAAQYIAAARQRAAEDAKSAGEDGTAIIPAAAASASASDKDDFAFDEDAPALKFGYAPTAAEITAHKATENAFVSAFMPLPSVRKDEDEDALDDIPLKAASATAATAAAKRTPLALNRSSSLGSNSLSTTSGFKLSTISWNKPDLTSTGSRQSSLVDYDDDAASTTSTASTASESSTGSAASAGTKRSRAESETGAADADAAEAGETGGESEEPESKRSKVSTDA